PTANPSPPLFPLPHTIRLFDRLSLSLSAASTTFRAARSIRTRDGIPIVPIVYASAAFIVLPSMIYFIFTAPFPAFIPGYRKKTRSPASVVRISHVLLFSYFFFLCFSSYRRTL